MKDQPNAFEDYQVYQDEDSVIFTYKRSTVVSTYRIFPGVLLGFNDIRTRELPPVFPASELFTSKVVLRVNFSMEGICELYTRDENYVYIKGGMLCSEGNGQPCPSAFHPARTMALNYIFSKKR